jgi:glycosyltransferase involved in cell wall biosynthesis
MKILFVTNEIPYPPDNGVRIVSYNAMRLMRESGHELALAVLTEEKNNISERFKKVSLFCEDNCSCMMKLVPRNKWVIQLKSFFYNQPFPIERHQNQSFRDKLIWLINEFQPDVVHFDVIAMTRYYDVVPVSVGIVGSINDSYSLTLINSLAGNRYTGLQYLYRKFQLYQSKVYEASVYERFDGIHVMTDVDADYLKKLNDKIQTSIIPNGVNPKLFHIKDETFDKTDIIFVAKLIGANLYSLQEFLKICWPVIHTASPKTTLYIVGELSDDALEVKDKISNTDGVCLTGYVQFLEDAYAKCGIAIVPINKNCGIINKAIEAMASGMAVVGFDKSFAGINGAKKNTHYISVGDYKMMGPAVVDLIKNASACQEIKSAAYSYAKANFSWSSRVDKYQSMYRDAMNQAKRRAGLRVEKE